MSTARTSSIGMAFLFLCGTAWAQPRDAQPGAASSVQEGGLNFHWEARLPMSGGERLLRGVLRDDCLYVITDGGTLFSLHAETGLLRWGSNLTDPAYTIFSPAHLLTADKKGPVVIPTSTEVVVKDRYSGDDIMRFRPEYPTGGPATGYDGLIILGSNNGRVQALSFDAARRTEPVKRWEVETGGPVTAAPVMYGRGQLLIASQSGKIFSCLAANKTLNWKSEVSGPVAGDPAVDASGAYIASMDRSLYKFSTQTGALIWRKRFPSALETGPVVAAQTAYQFARGSGVAALDAITGDEKWRIPEATQFAAHSSAGDILFVPPQRLHVVHHDTGEVISTVSVPQGNGVVANPTSDAVYILGEQGRVWCLRLDKVPYLRRQQVLMTKEGLNLPPPPPMRAEPPPPRPAPPPRQDPFRSRRDVPPPTSP